MKSLGIFALTLLAALFGAIGGALLVTHPSLRPPLSVGTPVAVPAVSTATVPASASGKPADNQTGRNQATHSYARAVALAENAVVSIYTSDAASRGVDSEGLFGQSRPNSSGVGSGVIISRDGYIITNFHVIRSAGQIFISAPGGRDITAKVVGTDPETDLALLKADLPWSPHPIVFADSDQLHNGDVVLAIGNPFGVGKTVTMGIVSALGRSDVGINTYERFIQTDAAINPGNSGGALINTQGELVGINTAIVSNSGSYQGIAFAVPSNQVQTIIDSLKNDGKVVRGWLGVSIHTAYIEEYERDFVEVVGLFNDGPAEAAGLAPGDLIVQINSTKVRDSNQAKEVIAAIAPGKPIELLINRQDEELRLTATSSQRPSLAE